MNEIIRNIARNFENIARNYGGMQRQYRHTRKTKNILKISGIFSIFPSLVAAPIRHLPDFQRWAFLLHGVPIGYRYQYVAWLGGPLCHFTITIPITITTPLFSKTLTPL